jgi:membrane associated rhomboid family serine protease
MKNLQMLLNVPTVGASGAIFGILLAFGVLFPNTQLMLLFPPIPIKAKYFVIGYGAIELYLAIMQPGSNIAHAAHLGGMLFGFILIQYWKKTTKTLY